MQIQSFPGAALSVVGDQLKTHICLYGRSVPAGALAENTPCCLSENCPVRAVTQKNAQDSLQV